MKNVKEDWASPQKWWTILKKYRGTRWKNNSSLHSNKKIFSGDVINKSMFIVAGGKNLERYQGLRVQRKPYYVYWCQSRLWSPDFWESIGIKFAVNNELYYEFDWHDSSTAVKNFLSICFWELYLVTNSIQLQTSMKNWRWFSYFNFQWWFFCLFKNERCGQGF